MLSCWTDWWAEYVSWHIAARMPRSFEAAIETPAPEPHTRMPRSAAPRRISVPTVRATSG